MRVDLIKKNYFRKIAFGLGPNADVRSSPVDWARAQVNLVPSLAWDGPVFSEEFLLDKRANISLLRVPFESAMRMIDKD